MLPNEEGLCYCQLIYLLKTDVSGVLSFWSQMLDQSVQHKPDQWILQISRFQSVVVLQVPKEAAGLLRWQANNYDVSGQLWLRVT
jgi:hypothetical protein